LLFPPSLLSYISSPPHISVSIRNLSERGRPPLVFHLLRFVGVPFFSSFSHLFLFSLRRVKPPLFPTLGFLCLEAALQKTREDRVRSGSPPPPFLLCVVGVFSIVMKLALAPNHPFFPFATHFPYMIAGLLTAPPTPLFLSPTVCSSRVASCGPCLGISAAQRPPARTWRPLARCPISFSIYLSLPWF